MSDRVLAWAQSVASSQTAVDPRLGSLRLVDTAARLRGLQAVEAGQALALGRPLTGGGSQSYSYTGRPAVELQVDIADNGDLTVGSDRLAIDCHGFGITHVDALSHIGVRGRWHGGVDDSETRPSIANLARVGIFTRAILLDIPAVRGTDYVEIETPVTAADLQRALAAARTAIEPGDALMLYMGRDRWERDRGPLKPTSDSPEGRPGVGLDGGRWIGEQPISALAWDMGDAYNSEEGPLCVHLLIWAKGLVLVDNCDLAGVRQALAGRRTMAGLLVVTPLNVPGATGSAVNPLFVY
jgi:kynurenine formamidase